MSPTEAQLDRLDRIEGRHPATAFAVCGFVGAAIVVDWYDLEGEGQFGITPAGMVLSLTGEDMVREAA